MYTYMRMHAYKQTYRQAGRQAGRQTDSQNMVAYD